MHGQELPYLVSLAKDKELKPYVHTMDRLEPPRRYCRRNPHLHDGSSKDFRHCKFILLKPPYLLSPCLLLLYILPIVILTTLLPPRQRFHHSRRDKFYNVMIYSLVTIPTEEKLTRIRIHCHPTECTFEYADRGQHKTRSNFDQFHVRRTIGQ